MKRALAWIACLMLLTPLMAAEQPKSGDMALGAKYGTISTESDLGDHSEYYGAEWEGWINDQVSFGLAAFRPTESADFSGDFFLAYHYKMLFVQGEATYLNVPDDTGLFGVGVGLSIMPKDKVRLKVMAGAQKVLGTLNVIRGIEPVQQSPALESGCWDDCSEGPEYQSNVEAVDMVYRVEGGLSWVW